MGNATTYEKINDDGSSSHIPAEEFKIGDTVVLPEEGTYILQKGLPTCMQRFPVGMRYFSNGRWWLLAQWGRDPIGKPVTGILGDPIDGNCDIPHPDHEFVYLQFETVPATS